MQQVCPLEIDSPTIGFSFSFSFSAFRHTMIATCIHVFLYLFTVYGIEATGVRCKVGKVVLSNHGTDAVFDVSKEIADILINFSLEQNLQEISFSIPDELPKLQKDRSGSLNRFNGRGGGRGSKGRSGGWNSTARHFDGYGEQPRYRVGKERQFYSERGSR